MRYLLAAALAAVLIPLTPSAVAAQPDGHGYHACTKLPPHKWPCLAEADTIDQSDPVIGVHDCFHARWDTAEYARLKLTGTDTTTGDHFTLPLQLHDGHARICPDEAGKWRFTWRASDGPTAQTWPSKIVVFVWVHERSRP